MEKQYAQQQAADVQLEKDIALLKAKSGGHVSNDPGAAGDSTNDPTKSLSGGGGTKVQTGSAEIMPNAGLGA